jgi:alpha-L-fucosidase
MYIQGSSVYNYHVKTYGHPSIFGYKDILPLWKAEKWNPDELMALYKKSGARYFVAQANHHDNFDNWNSTFQEWNSVNIGPKRDVAGEWKKAADKYGLPFGVSVHTGDGYRWNWWSVAFGSDKTGPLKGVPYDAAVLTKADGKGKWWDGYDPEHLYGPPRVPKEDSHKGFEDAPVDYQNWWASRINNLVDVYHPDMLYFDGHLPWSKNPGDPGLRVAANYFNSYAAAHDNHFEGIITLKDPHPHTTMLDYERGFSANIAPEPWQTDTSVGDWFYNRNYKNKDTGTMYKSSRTIITTLIDITSKNGNLLLNVIQHPDGTIDPEAEALLNQIGDWLSINGEGIYATRPWKLSGEGPTKAIGGKFSEGKGQSYTGQDIRFTQSKDGKTLYAFTLALPTDNKIVIKSLPTVGGKISAVSLLGCADKVEWRQTDDGLTVSLPASSSSLKTALGFKIVWL